MDRQDPFFSYSLIIASGPYKVNLSLPFCHCVKSGRHRSKAAALSLMQQSFLKSKKRNPFPKAMPLYEKP